MVKISFGIIYCRHEHIYSFQIKVYDVQLDIVNEVLCCFNIGQPFAALSQANMRHPSCVGLMLGQRRRRWSNNKPTQNGRLVSVLDSALGTSISGRMVQSNALLMGWMTAVSRSFADLPRDGN